MTYTYTYVHKDYPAETFGEAAAEALRDRAVWRDKPVASYPENAYPTEHGLSDIYALIGWRWDAEAKVLRVYLSSF